jgi:DmsE family decaheme c-type cytochrome
VARSSPSRLFRLAGAAALLLASAAGAADPEPGYVGDSVCLGCHETTMAEYGKTPHAKIVNERAGRTEQMRLGCEACHGPGQAHVEAGGARVPGGMLSFRAETSEERERENAACLGCHSGASRLHWAGSTHEMAEISCTSCHSVMKNVSKRGLLAHPDQMRTCGSCHPVQRAQVHRASRMPLREGWMECTSCHQPHGTVSEALLDAPSVNDNCYRCHADKRGPFLWEHPPVSESCLNCHEPHGSVRHAMLKATVPRLCQQCHLQPPHPTEARLPQNRFVVGAGCLNCHSNIHGSNHPSGLFFSR